MGIIVYSWIRKGDDAYERKLFEDFNRENVSIHKHASENPFYSCLYIKTIIKLWLSYCRSSNPGKYIPLLYPNTVTIQPCNQRGLDIEHIIQGCVQIDDVGTAYTTRYIFRLDSRQTNSISLLSRIFLWWRFSRLLDSAVLAGHFTTKTQAGVFSVFSMS